MSPQEILALAEQGDPIAIAVLINYLTKPLNVSVRVQRQGHHLDLLLEAKPLPSQQTAVNFICNSLNVLNVTAIETATIYGLCRGDRIPAWYQVISLHPPNSPFSLNGAGEQSLPWFAPESPVPNSLPDSLSPHPTIASPEKPNPERASDTIPTSSTELLFRKGTSSFMVQSSETPDLLKRPEAVILIVFISLLVFWDAYISLLDDMDSDTALSSRQLAQRLGTSKRAIRHKKRQDDFSQWTQSLDPEGTAWIYRNGAYTPK